MNDFFIEQILKSFAEGDWTKIIGYGVIFFTLWLEVRGLKKAVKNLTTTIGKSFADGEKRFDALELKDQNFEHRLTVLEQHHLGG